MIFLCAGPLSAANTETVLGTLKTRSGMYHYIQPDISMQAARFDLERPCVLKRLRIMLSGPAGGTAMIHIFGHEGGGPSPLLEKDLIPPFLIQKSVKGREVLEYSFGKGLSLSSRQFFVAVEKTSDGTVLLADKLARKASCSSPEGGEYYFQSIKHDKSGWVHGKYSFLIEAVVDYGKAPSPRFIEDTAAFASIEKNIGVFSGIACDDVNGDGFADILAGSKLFYNNGRGEFSRVVNMEKPGDKKLGNIIIDMDNDGQRDIILIGRSASGNSSARLFINRHNEKFEERRISFPQLVNPTSISIADLDNNGYPDLFIGELSPDSLHNSTNHLLFNTGAYDFEERRDILADGPAFSRGSSFVDLNNDGFQDLYISRPGYGDEVYRNQGKGNFTRSSLSQILRSPALSASYSAGCHWADMNNDGFMDLLLPARAGIYAKKQDGATGTGIYDNTGSETAMLDKNMLFGDAEYEEKHSGGAWGDINNDGREDFILTTACQCRYAEIYVQNERGGFDASSVNYGIEGLAENYDALWADLNNDGLLDMLVADKGNLRVFRQQSDEKTSNFVALDLHSVSGNHLAIGARVIIYAGEKQYTKTLTSGRGLLMQDPLRLHFGLADTETVDSAAIVWPTGTNSREIFTDIQSNRINRIREGQHSSAPRTYKNTVTLFPNPFSKEARFSISLAAPARVKIKIFSLSGQLVKSLPEQSYDAPGVYGISWNGRDDTGQRLGSGNYIYSCTINGTEYTGSATIVE